MKHLIFATLALSLIACNKNTDVMKPLKDAGCAAESVLTSSAGGVIASATGAADAAGCGQALQVALGNANLCATPIQPQAAGLAAQSTLPWKSVGDIPADALKKKPGMVAQDVHVQGLVGSIVCPIADSAILGFLSAAIPKACQGPKSLDANVINEALKAACILAVPI